jgi:Ni,Fe-hydrogenase I large subunit
VRAVENALDVRIPPNARLIRNLIAGMQWMQDHVIHFYHLHALDWVDITSALQADPEATCQLQQSITDWPGSPGYFRQIQQRLQTFVDSGQLSIFTNGYWGHPAYNLPPEANLMAVTHYLEALDWQRRVIVAHAILGAKNPHLQTYLVGGVSIPVSQDSQFAINAEQIGQLRELYTQAANFVEQVYLPDVLAVAPFYPDWFALGEHTGNFLSYGDFPLHDTLRADDPGNLYLPRGIILNRDLSTVFPVDQERIAEYVTHSWYEYPEGGDAAGRHPWEGVTAPNYTGPQPPYDLLNVDDKYSWVKAPRYDGHAMEVGPLARMLVAYASGHELVQALVNQALSTLGAGPEALFSTLGRVAARCIESVVIARQSVLWLDELEENIARGDYRIHDPAAWDPGGWPGQALGWGFHEAPRGALGHWVRIEDQRIANYQAVVPSTWNGSPRDPTGQMGPWEAALMGTPVADPAQPIEILRTIHSFDPCMACAVHVMDAKGREVTRIQIA